jgi:hypothetical protein
MEWALNRGARGWMWKITGECDIDELGRMQADALRVMEEPADTVVQWSDTDWVHLAFLQVLLSLRKGVCGGGNTFAFQVDGTGYQEILRSFGMSSAFGDPISASA